MEVILLNLGVAGTVLIVVFGVWGGVHLLARRQLGERKMGCKGPETYNNCAIVKWNEGTSWPVQAGHPCIGCSEPNFWDDMSPFYKEK